MSEMNIDWQVGDSVCCVHSDCCEGRLKAGTVYKIAGLPSVSYLQVKGVDGSWHRDRFKLVGIAADPKPAPVAEPNPYDDWKTGDSVRCLDDLCSKGLLHSQHVYEIEQILHPNKLLCLVGVAENWGFSRFERVAPIVDVHSEPDKPVVRVGSRVRCDDASGSGTPWIVLGEIYTVSAIGDQPDGDTFIGVDGTAALSWKLSRFTLLPDEVAPAVPAAQADQSDVDLMNADEARRRCDERFMEHCRELRHVAKAAIDSAIISGDASATIDVPHGDYYPLQRWLSRLGYRVSIDAKKIGCVLARISW